jgi:hypothetical protein
VQVLGEVPAELRVTGERDERLLQQAQALAPTDAVRLLDLVSAALEATTDGAQPRIQLELALIKAAAPQYDPSTGALLARIERLEAGAPPAPPVLAPIAPPVPTPAASPVPAPAAQPAPPPADPPPPGRLELDAALTAWPAIVAVIREDNAMLASVLVDARPVAITERELLVAFPSGAEFFKRKAEQDDYRRIAADAVRKVTGAQLALRYELREHRAEMTEPEAATTLSGEELVKRFLEEFNAEELLDDEPDEREAH